MCKARDQLVVGGFDYFPKSTEPPTYRSALVKSTIDFVFHRNVTFHEPEISSVFIAQHRPVSANIELPSHAVSLSTSLDVAYG
jgi:hypothetical protein